MVTVLTVIVVIGALCAAFASRLRSAPAFVVGIAATLGFWIAPFVLPPSYASALYLILGLVGSVICGLVGVVAWWQSRGSEHGRGWLWLAGGALAVLPAVVVGGYELLR